MKKGKNFKTNKLFCVAIMFVLIVCKVCVLTEKKIVLVDSAVNLFMALLCYLRKVVCGQTGYMYKRVIIHY